MIPNVHYLQSLLASHAHRHPLRNILPFSHRVTYTDWYPLFRANNTVFLVHIKPFPKVSLAQGPHQGTKEPRATPRNQGTRAAKVNFKKKKTCRQILNHS